MEKNEGFKEKGKGDLFFRNGKIGTWKDEVPVNIIRKIPVKTLLRKKRNSIIITTNNESNIFD